MVTLEEASYVTLRGMTFEDSRGMGIYIERGSGNLIAGCTFRNLGTFAVFMGRGIEDDPDGLTGYRLQNAADRCEIVKFEPASRTPGSYSMALYADTTWDRQAGTNHGVVGCDIYNTGAAGIVLGGGDRKTLTPAGNYVLNCHIHHFARLDGRFGAIVIDGVGNRVAHCLIHDAPVVAISFVGNDHVLEFNEIHDICLPPVHDMGAVYTGRDPSAQGNLIRNNFFHHIGNPETSTCAVYLDDGACGATVSGNVFYRVQTDALFGWGHNHLVRNNIFIDTRALIPAPMDNARWTGYMADPLQVLRLRKTINVLQPPYVTRYPELAHLFEEDPNYPRRNLVRDNVSVQSGEFGSDSNDVKGNWVTDEDPGFVDAAGMNFQLKADSAVWTKIPGFQRIPFEWIGLYTDEYHVSPRGNDAWSGRLSDPSATDGPFATLERARDAIRALRRTQSLQVPVRVTIHGGTYYLDSPLEFGPRDSGTEQAPVVYAAAAGEEVVLSGGRRLEGGRWGEVNGRKAWVVDIPEVKAGTWRFRQLFVNGERRPRTRLPKQGEYRIESLPGYTGDFLRSPTKQFVYAPGDIVPTWRNLQDVEIVGITRWLDNRLPIESVDGSDPDSHVRPRESVCPRLVRHLRRRHRHPLGLLGGERLRGVWTLPANGISIVPAECCTICRDRGRRCLRPRSLHRG